MVIGKRDAPVVLFLELVLPRRAVWIPPPPELFDEVLFLDGSGQVSEGALLLVRNDVDDVLLQPLLKGIDLLFLGLGNRIRRENQEGECQKTN